jgi:hypothetical protein|tara:strand:- start:615 stop:866 length:252 start_codon:yes stop_codon:yes gene_type:complete
MIELILIGLLSILFGTSCYVIWNTNKKLELMEDWITNFSDRIVQVNEKVREIDYKGYFAEDDETGHIFTQLKETINELNNFRG